jgi:GH25 family lysozyme M1 (1,4-beta-N-acetylmuramidase)
VLRGIDVSHHQGAIDWRAVARAGQAFAWCKASEGTGFRDSRFSANWAGIRASGMVRGAYHFLRSDSDPRAQARHFLSVVGNLSGSMAALDVESSGASRPTAAQARAFKSEFARITGGHPLVIYTGRWYWRGVLGNPYGADLGPLWHSAYTGSPGPLYGGWPRFTFWQYTATGRCPGVRGNVDLNQFFGDRAALAALQEDDVTPREVEAVLVKVISSPGHRFRAELAEIIDSRLELKRIATRDVLVAESRDGSWWQTDGKTRRLVRGREQAQRLLDSRLIRAARDPVEPYIWPAEDIERIPLADDADGLDVSDLDVSDLAERISAQLPAGTDVDRDAVEAAVRAALADLTT